MKKNHQAFYVLLVLIFLAPNALFSQGKYSISESNPYGKANPSAPEQIKDFDELIGLCECLSVSRNPDQTWAEPVAMTWKWSYIMDGKAVMDETIKEDGSHSGSIRQYNQDSSRWQVHYFSSLSPAPILPVWTGGKKGDKIVLYREQSAPGGQEGFYRLTFYDIDDQGYKWVGEWVDLTEKIVFPTWKIECKRS